jgi:hypothetical protein
MPHYRFCFVTMRGEVEGDAEALCGDDAAALRHAHTLLAKEQRSTVEIWRAQEYLGSLARATRQQRPAPPAWLARSLPFIHDAHDSPQ